MLVWAVVIFAYVLKKDFGGITRSLAGVAGALMHRKLLLLLGSAPLYSVTVVFVANKLDLWHSPALKATIYWFLGTAIVLSGSAVTEVTRDGEGFLASVSRQVVAATILIEFVVSVYALPLALELVLMMIAILFAGMQALYPYQASITRETRAVIDGVLVVVGLIYLGHFVVTVLLNPGGFLM